MTCLVPSMPPRRDGCQPARLSLPFPHASIIRPGLVSSPGKGTAGLESEAELEEEGEVGDEEEVVVGDEYVDDVLGEEELQGAVLAAYELFEIVLKMEILAARTSIKPPRA